MNSDVMGLVGKWRLAANCWLPAGQSALTFRACADELEDALNAQAPVAWMDADGLPWEPRQKEIIAEVMRDEGKDDTMRALYLAPPSTTALQAKVARLEGALLAYQRAGFGNSTDFRLQAEASELARAALASEVQS